MARTARPTLVRGTGSPDVRAMLLRREPTMSDRRTKRNRDRSAATRRAIADSRD